MGTGEERCRMHPSLPISSEGQYGVSDGVLSLAFNRDHGFAGLNLSPPLSLVAGARFTVHSHGLHHRKEVHITSHHIHGLMNARRRNVTVCE